MQDFRKLKVWEIGHLLALAVYKVTRTFPREELYGLTMQMRRTSVSIPTNIAEGCGRNRDTEFSRFLQIAMGSAFELEYQILLSRDLGFINKQTDTMLSEQIVQIKQMLTALIQKLKADS
ncbi:MAG: four helix bundle protein [Thermodesulfobacteriota bacterium]